MGLQCSILGHAFEDAGVERDREEQGSEVITTEREIERCRRCGTERVVSESTEVAAVVDASDVEGVDADRNDEADPASEGASDSDFSGGELSGAIEHSGAGGSKTEPNGSDAGGSDADGLDATPPGDAPTTPAPEASGDDPSGPDDPPGPIETDDTSDPTEADDPPDPAEEDAEILTDDDVERAPGQWPDEPAPDSDGDSDETAPVVETSADDDSIAPAEEPLSGITVPDGEIVCPECTFRIEADSGYRAGDPCPECNAWLEAERNQ